MKALLIIFILIGHLTTVQAFDMGQEDKQKHMALSGAIAMPAYMTLRANKYSRLESGAIAFAITLLIGHAKETNDRRYDDRDMGANALGAAGGIMIPLSFNF